VLGREIGHRIVERGMGIVPVEQSAQMLAQGVALGRGRHLVVRLSSASCTVPERGESSHRSGCDPKNAHISRVASMALLVGPTHHFGSGLPPGQVCPPSAMV
jgi:hypothetical protein